MTGTPLDPRRVEKLVGELWDDAIVPTLTDYIRIPNKSPAFDPDWRAHGYMDDAVALFEAWARTHALAGMTVEVVRLEGRTPVIYIEIPGSVERTLLLYGHLDKQPEMTGWRDGLGPWTPALIDGRLYGRGGADDGYAMFGSLAAAHALREQGVVHANLKILIEASEESGSPDLPAYTEALAERIGDPDLVVCLDSGCGNYDQLWVTTSLRGIAAGTLTVDVLTEGVHSGDASGIVPSTFRVARQLLSRLESETSGAILPAAFRTEIPPERVRQARFAAQVLGDEVYTKFPFHAGVGPALDDRVELILNRTWRAALEVTGAAGLPALADAGNVLRPSTALKLSLRVPPNCDAEAATAALETLLEEAPPFGAKVSFVPEHGGDGWDAPPTAPWLERAVEEASNTYFGRPAAAMGEGGSIPFMAMLGDRYPGAQFLVTGVLGPHSNAHGPNEFLHVPTGKRITSAITEVIAQHALHATAA